MNSMFYCFEVHKLVKHNNEWKFFRSPKMLKKCHLEAFDIMNDEAWDFSNASHYLQLVSCLGMWVVCSLFCCCWMNVVVVLLKKSLIRCIFSKFKVKNLFSAEDHGRISNGRNLGLLFGKNFRVLASIFAKGLANYVKQQRSIIGTSWTYSVLPTHM